MKNSRTFKNQGWKTHFFKNNSRPNKIQEHSRTFKDLKDQWPLPLEISFTFNFNSLEMVRFDSTCNKNNIRFDSTFNKNNIIQ